MRRTRSTVSAVVLALVLFGGVGTVSAETGIWVEIGLPLYMPTDGALDMVVLTGPAPEYTTAPNCFGAGDFPVYSMSIIDRTTSLVWSCHRCHHFD